MIAPKQRVKWDLFVFVVIVVSAFVVPFDLLVGWDDPRVDAWFNYVFLVVFLVDMILNCFTIRRKTYGGFWGWRNVAGIFCRRLSPSALEARGGGRRSCMTRSRRWCCRTWRRDGP